MEPTNPPREEPVGMRSLFSPGTPVRTATALLIAVVILLSYAMPAYAQSNAEEEDDANKTAKTPEECVRPDAPDQDDLSDVSRSLEANQAYEDCLERTKDNSGGDNDGPDATETAEPNAAEVNRNATEPEECVEPAAPGEDYDPDEYKKEQQAYDDCLLRTGPDGGDDGAGGNEGNGQGGDEGDNGSQGGSGSGNPDSECVKPEDDAPADEMREYEALP